MSVDVNRECFADDGRPKRRYLRRRDAKNAIRAAGPNLADARPYTCGTCGYFHIGHYPNNPLTRAQLRARHRQETA